MMHLCSWIDELLLHPIAFALATVAALHKRVSKDFGLGQRQVPQPPRTGLPGPFIRSVEFVCTQMKSAVHIIRGGLTRPKPCRGAVEDNQVSVVVDGIPRIASNDVPFGFVTSSSSSTF